MAERGYNYMIEVNTGSTTTPSWDAVRIRGGSFPDINQVHGSVDITAHGDSSLPWRTHLLTLYEAQNVTVNVLSGGSTSQALARTTLQGSIGDSDGIALRLVDSSASSVVWQATYLVTGCTLRAPLDDAVSFDYGLMLDGEPATHFGS